MQVSENVQVNAMSHKNVIFRNFVQKIARQALFVYAVWKVTLKNVEWNGATTRTSDYGFSFQANSSNIDAKYQKYRQKKQK